MLERLKKRWKASGLRLILILCTFAVGGSLTGYAGKKLMNGLNVGNPVAYVIIYILLITILWPLAVLLVSIPLGQFSFFKKYITRLGNRIFKRNKSQL
jgi:hypothetical protein